MGRVKQPAREQTPEENTWWAAVGGRLRARYDGKSKKGPSLATREDMKRDFRERAIAHNNKKTTLPSQWIDPEWFAQTHVSKSGENDFEHLIVGIDGAYSSKSASAPLVMAYERQRGARVDPLYDNKLNKRKYSEEDPQKRGYAANGSLMAVSVRAANLPPGRRATVLCGAHLLLAPASGGGGMTKTELRAAGANLAKEWSQLAQDPKCLRRLAASAEMRKKGPIRDLFLDADTIGAFLDVVQKSSAAEVACFPPGYLNLRGPEGGLDMKNVRVNRVLERVKRESTRKVLFPVHDQGAVHWLLAVATVQRDGERLSGVSVQIFDSLVKSPEGPRYRNICDGVRKLLEPVTTADCEWSYVVLTDIPKQPNEYDCGLFACRYAQCCAFDMDVTTYPFRIADDEESDLSRQRLLRELVGGELEWLTDTAAGGDGGDLRAETAFRRTDRESVASVIEALQGLPMHVGYEQLFAEPATLEALRVPFREGLPGFSQAAVKAKRTRLRGMFEEWLARITEDSDWLASAAAPSMQPDELEKRVAALFRQGWEKKLSPPLFKKVRGHYRSIDKLWNVAQVRATLRRAGESDALGTRRLVAWYVRVAESTGMGIAEMQALIDTTVGRVQWTARGFPCTSAQHLPYRDPSRALPALCPDQLAEYRHAALLRLGERMPSAASASAASAGRAASRKPPPKASRRPQFDLGLMADRQKPQDPAEDPHEVRKKYWEAEFNRAWDAVVD